MSEDTAQKLIQMQNQVSQGLSDSIKSVVEEEPQKAQAVYDALPELTKMATDAETQIAMRLDG